MTRLRERTKQTAPELRSGLESQISDGSVGTVTVATLSLREPAVFGDAFSWTGPLHQCGPLPQLLEDWCVVAKDRPVQV